MEASLLVALNDEIAKWHDNSERVRPSCSPCANLARFQTFPLENLTDPSQTHGPSRACSDMIQPTQGTVQRRPTRIYATRNDTMTEKTKATQAAERYADSWHPRGLSSYHELYRARSPSIHLNTELPPRRQVSPSHPRVYPVCSLFAPLFTLDF